MSRPTNVRPFAEHEFIADDSESEVIDRIRVVLSTNHFGCHVAWGSRSIGTVFNSEVPSDSQIGDSDVAVPVENEVFRLDVPVNDFIFM